LAPGGGFVVRIVGVALACAALLGCERGCLSRAITEKRREVEPPALDLTGTDCPADVYRCRAGQVERALGGHVPAVCERGEACRCPFEPERVCERGCVVEDTELLLDDGGAALCVSGGARAVPVVAPAGPCDSDDVICVNGGIVRCSPTPRVVARCLRGCSGHGALDPDAPPQALDALCNP